LPHSESLNAAGTKVYREKASVEKHPFPLVVRIDDRALDPLREKDIRHQGTVDRVILGTRAIGTCWTTGGIGAQIIPKQDDACIIIRFRGNTRVMTTGYNGPALIFSHTDTEFECARMVVFDTQIGLIAGRPVVDARTTLVYDGFNANRRLGKRLISRVAKQRADEQWEQARTIAHQQNKAEICRAFENRLDVQLDSINRRLEIARYVNALFGPSAKPNLVSSSSKDCILIGIGKEGTSSALAEMLPHRKNPQPIEILVHSSMLGERFSGMALAAEKIENYVLPAAQQLQILQVVMGIPPSSERQFEVSFQSGWIVIGLKNEATKHSS